MELNKKFEEAVASSKKLSQKPANDILLKLYSLYKQATEGDAPANAPAGFDFVAKFKYESWAAIRGLSQEEAMSRYIDLVNELSAA